MFTPAERAKYQSAWEGVVDLLGVPAIWRQAKPPRTSKNVTLGFKTVGMRDEELVNAFGVGAKVLTIKVRDLPVIEKFDQIEIGNERYTIDTVLPIHLNGVHVFHKCFVKGRG